MPNTNKSTVVGIYIRLSTDSLGQIVDSADKQRISGADLAKEAFESNVILKYYFDNEGDSSELDRLLDDAKQGKLQAVITYHTKNLNRLILKSLELIIEILESDVRFFSVRQGEFGTPESTPLFNLLVSFGQIQNISESRRSA